MSKHPIGVHVGPGLTTDGDLENGGPLAAAAEMDADGVQLFLTDPQSYKSPRPRSDAEALRRSDVMVIVHAPYMLNVASTNNRIRVPGRKLLAQHAEAASAIGARGMVVHGGHVLAEDDPAVGVDNWRKTFTYQARNGGFPLPLLIENTAGGGNAMARDLDAVARLWEAVGEFSAGFVLDTCHVWAAGWDLATAVDDIRAITGRVDLVHLNNSRDPAGSSRDRHAPLAGGEIPLELLVEVARSADCPTVLETPGDAAAHAEEIQVLRQALTD
ncbi:MAG: deoxyribonuclease IV [Actinomycetota bacterium]|nr:deoxyribonuclease IV [Actinomycetota bacterium]